MKRIALYCMIGWMVAVTAAIHARDIQTDIPVVELDYDTLSTDTFFVAQMRLITPCDTTIRIDTIIHPDSIIQILDTIFQPDSIIRVDTIFHSDSIIHVDTIIQPDSIIYVDTIIQMDTTIIEPDTLIHVDTLVVQDTLIHIDTLVVQDTLIHVDTLMVTDTIPVIDTTFVTDTLRYMDTLVVVDTITHDTLRLHALIRHRGSSSLKYRKQSYAIKLLDSVGAKLDTSLLGLREDNYWILDAMASDKARMRNRVAYDLWLDFSTKPHYYDKEPELINGSNGQFVEVNANGNYRGLYCLMERVDRKQLKLKKMKDGEVRGILYKSVNWKNGFFSAALDPYDLHSETWGCYEIQFPDTAGYVPWQPLYDAMEFAGKSDDELYMQQVALRYDLPVFMDLYLFYAVLSARDCMGKNTFLSYYNIPKDSMLVPTPWDMDHSFGRMYNGNEEDSRKAFTGWAPKLYTRLERLDPTYTATLNARYAALRHEEFDARRLKERFAQYFDLFRQTGVDKREERRWSGVNSIDLDFEAEELYIYNWLDQRLAYCDSIFNYVSEVTTALTEEVEPSTAMNTEPTAVTNQLINGHLYLRKVEQLYDLQGRRVK